MKMTPSQRLIQEAWQHNQEADFHILQALSTLSSADTSHDPKLSRQPDETLQPFDSQIDPTQDIRKAISILTTTAKKLDQAKSLLSQ